MASALRPALDLLVPYARCHRDRRNILTHLVGVPVVVFAASVLLARPALELGGWVATPAWLAFAVAALWYLTRGTLALGTLTVLAVGCLVALGQGASAGVGVAPWLALGLGLFVAGWCVQLLGHYYEGRMAALSDDPAGLLVGPMFVVLELAGGLGGLRTLHREVERRAGPTMIRDLAQPLAR